jgi:hypothetical protein
MKKLVFREASAARAGFLFGPTRSMRSATIAVDAASMAGPADARDDRLGRTSCRQGAEGAQHDVPTVGEGRLALEGTRARWS